MSVKSLNIKTALGILVALLIATLTMIGGLALWRLQSVMGTVQNIYDNSVTPLRLLRGVADGYGLTIVDSAQKLRAGAIGASEALSQMRTARQSIRQS